MHSDNSGQLLWHKQNEHVNVSQPCWTAPENDKQKATKLHHLDWSKLHVPYLPICIHAKTNASTTQHQLFCKCNAPTYSFMKIQLMLLHNHNSINSLWLQCQKHCMCQGPKWSCWRLTISGKKGVPKPINIRSDCLNQGPLKGKWSHSQGLQAHM